ncbi:hypothetical protein GUJ93_ZPchr0002g23226 [Zizania palustris]|uniref:Mannosyltransferase n=1 Tax=Zizania palustris TaxID=103762 RepID=A0A8J5S4D5_ZIZPA|nr:hypothetical protein GUJ93_ZPchr0002g23226 [Zizania palustris]
MGGCLRWRCWAAPTGYFNPDEHWQCLQVARRISFGYGHLTWEWKRGLRSYLHPLNFAAFYKIMALFHLDTFM